MQYSCPIGGRFDAWLATTRSVAGAARTPPVSAPGRRSRQPLELNQPADVVTEVHHPDLKPRPARYQFCARSCPHRVLLVAEYMHDRRAHPRGRRVRRLLALRQRTISCGAPADTALQALRLRARVKPHRAVGDVRPDPLLVLERSSTSSSFSRGSRPSDEAHWWIVNLLNQFVAFVLQADHRL